MASIQKLDFALGSEKIDGFLSKDDKSGAVDLVVRFSGPEAQALSERVGRLLANDFACHANQLSPARKVAMCHTVHPTAMPDRQFVEEQFRLTAPDGTANAQPLLDVAIATLGELAARRQIVQCPMHAADDLLEKRGLLPNRTPGACHVPSAVLTSALTMAGASLLINPKSPD